jgi:hypothetical protein
MLAGQYAQQLLLLPSQKALQLERLQQQQQQQQQKTMAEDDGD